MAILAAAAVPRIAERGTSPYWVHRPFLRVARSAPTEGPSMQPSGEAIMGKFIYDGLVKVDFEDRLLAHLQLVIGAKIRRGESFHFTWKDDQSIGNGRTTVWVHPRVSVVYKFYGGKPPAINRAWIDVLMFTANSPTGLYAAPEPAEHANGKAREVTRKLHEAH
jgi:hypothetical protein